MVRYVELRRHTDSDGDALTEEGVRAALEIGGGLDGYAIGLEVRADVAEEARA